MAGNRRDSSSSACTAWARRSTSRSSAPSARPMARRRAGSMRRSAATRICWPIWCGGCSRTAPTRPSSTASSTSRRRSTRSSPTRSRGCAGSPQAASAHPAAARSLRRGSGTIRAASISPIRPTLADLAEAAGGGGDRPWSAAPIVGGVEQIGSARDLVDPDRPAPHRRHGRRSGDRKRSSRRWRAPPVPRHPGTRRRRRRGPPPSSARPISTRRRPPR